MARGDWSLTRVAKIASTKRLTLISPRPRVTGSIRISTRRTRLLRQPSDIGNGPLPRREGSSQASWAIVPITIDTA